MATASPASNHSKAVIRAQKHLDPPNSPTVGRDVFTYRVMEGQVALPVVECID
ncbi:hypothetical protein CIP100629_00846 [Corynebacterium diphtheriae]|nr:hypothetical protein CIP100629_00846 [Corynebacterium diphtheriae]